MLNSNLGGVVGQLFFLYLWNCGEDTCGENAVHFWYMATVRDAVRNKRIIVARYTLADFATKTVGGGGTLGLLLDKIQVFHHDKLNVPLAPAALLSTIEK